MKRCVECLHYKLSGEFKFGPYRSKRYHFSEKKWLVEKLGT